MVTVYGEPVTVLARTDGPPDAHGNPTYTWAPSASVSALGVAPRQGEEDNAGGREAVIVGLTVYLPAGTQIAAVDRMVVRGETYQVVGEPGVWTNPYTGITRGVQVALERVEG